MLFLFYIGAFWFYFYVRVTKTLNLGKQYTWYGIVLLCVECMGATTVVIYGVNLLYNPVHETFPDDERQPGCPKVKIAIAYPLSMFCTAYTPPSLLLSLAAAAMPSLHP